MTTTELHILLELAGMMRNKRMSKKDFESGLDALHSAINEHANLIDGEVDDGSGIKSFVYYRGIGARMANGEKYQF